MISFKYGTLHYYLHNKNVVRLNKKMQICVEIKYNELVNRL